MIIGGAASNFWRSGLEPSGLGIRSLMGSSSVGFGCGRLASADLQQVDDEDQRVVLRDGARLSRRLVGQRGRDDHLATASDLHPEDTLVPAGDDVLGAD